jgi:D-hexose-6-phosphate mutarotase
VVWNPGSEEPAEENPAPGRLAVGDWRRLICVEPAILWKEAAVTVGPQAHHTLSA